MLLEHPEHVTRTPAAVQAAQHRTRGGSPGARTKEHVPVIRTKEHHPVFETWRSPKGPGPKHQITI